MGWATAGYAVAFSLPLDVFAMTLAFVLIATVASTVLQIIRARQLAEPGVIARLVAE